MSTAAAGLERLLAIMRRLRDPGGGCPWDLKQSFESIAPYTIEEAYEVADAIDRKDYSDLRSELGDLLFQVVFHSQLAEEANQFTFADVAEGISEKLTRRHPHVFAGGAEHSVESVRRSWETLKAEERSAKGLGVLDDVPNSLPALCRAEKLGKRAASVGFDWPSMHGARSSISNELAELDEAVKGEQGQERIFDELGDLLFSVVNLARHIGADPEHALRASCNKFYARFAAIETLLSRAGRRIQDVSAEELDGLWQQVKKSHTPL
jgi:MazG family protein